MNKIYAVCRVCGNLIYRMPGYVHGDGQHDTDHNPVWLLSQMNDLKFSREHLPRERCGCDEA